MDDADLDTEEKRKKRQDQTKLGCKNAVKNVFTTNIMGVWLSIIFMLRTWPIMMTSLNTIVLGLERPVMYQVNQSKKTVVILVSLYLKGC